MYIYKNLEDVSFNRAFYYSTMIQTLIGSDFTPRSDYTRMIMCTQAIIAYIITAGLIYFTITSHQKKSN